MFLLVSGCPAHSQTTLPPPNQCTVFIFTSQHLIGKTLGYNTKPLFIACCENKVSTSCKVLRHYTYKYHIKPRVLRPDQKCSEEPFFCQKTSLSTAISIKSCSQLNSVEKKSQRYDKIRTSQSGLSEHILIFHSKTFLYFK